MKFTRDFREKVKQLIAGKDTESKKTLLSSHANSDIHPLFKGACYQELAMLTKSLQPSLKISYLEKAKECYLEGKDKRATNYIEGLIKSIQNPQPQVPVQVNVKIVYTHNPYSLHSSIRLFKLPIPADAATPQVRTARDLAQ